MRLDEAWLLDILAACREIVQFTAGVPRETFLEDKKLQRAVCMDLEIIGEAAGAVSQEFRDSHPAIP